MDRIPPITVGTQANSEKDGEKKDSAGARLYVKLINQQHQKDPSRPVIVNIGGQSATLASAYVLDPSIAEKCIVYYSDIRVYNGHYQWASQLVAKHFRVISWGDDNWWISKRCQNEWRVLPRPEKCEGKDNSATSGEWRRWSNMKVPMLDYMIHQFQSRGEYSTGERKADGYCDGTFIHAWPPALFDDAALKVVRGGEVLHVTKFTERNEQLVKEFAIKVLLDPAAYLGRNGSPPSSMVPESAACTPPRMFISVDLPAPFSPTMPSTRPGASEKLIDLSTSTPKKRLSMARNSMSGAGWAMIQFPEFKRLRSTSRPAAIRITPPFIIMMVKC